MNLVIPTYQRIDSQLTWAALHPDVRKYVWFIARPEESLELEQRYPEAIVVPAPTVTDVSSTKQFILDTFSTESFIMLDDDCEGFWKRLRFFNPDCQNFKAERIESAEDQIEMFSAMLQELAKPYVGSVGIRPHYLFPSIKRLLGNEMPLHVLAMDGNTIAKHGWRHDRIKFGSDTDLGLQMLRDGYDTVQRADYFVKARTYTNTGGCNSTPGGTYRLDGNQRFHDLAGLWPEVMKLTTKTKGYHQNPYRTERKKFLTARRKSLGIIV